MKLVAINSSPNMEASVSRQLVEFFVESFGSGFGNGQVRVRDIGEIGPPHLNGEKIAAIFIPDDRRSDAQKQALAYSDELVDELIDADVIVIGAPMHNFSISSSLRTWIDHVVRAGRTFNYTDTGPKGHLTGKKVFVLTARGGDYSEGSFMHAMDHQEPYLRTVLGFIGLDDVTFIHAQGLAMGDEASDGAIANAKAAIMGAIESLSNSSKPRAA
jgi:FMN-dependent NADH-azoreductase